jgi:hypothetical protein
VDQARVAEFIDAAVNDPEEARRLARARPEFLTARYIHGETALHFLAVEGQAAAVRLLAAMGADVNAANKFGDTALVDAATLGSADVAAVLLECGADPNASSIARDNVLHAAAASGNAHLLRLLLAAGGRADYVTELGETIWDAIRPKDLDELEKVLNAFGVRRAQPGGGLMPACRRSPALMRSVGPT